MTHHRTGFPFHPVAGATGTDGHNISWTDGLSTQNIVEFPQHRGRAPCRGGFSREFLARGAANRKLAAGTEPAGRLYSGLRRSARNGAPRPSSEERRVGKEWVSKCRSRWATEH